MILQHGYEVESEAANVSHYGKPRRYDIVNLGNASSNCSYCHLGGGNEFGDVFVESHNADITHGVDCAACHGYGRIHDDVFTVPTMALGDNDLCFACHDHITNYTIVKSIFTSSIHGGANCTDCHTPLPLSIAESVREGEARLHLFEVPLKVEQMNVTLDWTKGDLNLTLIDPDGREINSSVAASDPDVDYVANKTRTRKYYSLRSPANGSWTARVTGIDLDGTESYTLTVDIVMKHPGTPPHDCKVCHATDDEEHIIPENTPLIGGHVTRGTSVSSEVWTDASCTDCHRNDIPDGLFSINGKTKSQTINCTIRKVYPQIRSERCCSFQPRFIDV